MWYILTLPLSNTNVLFRAIFKQILIEELLYSIFGWRFKLFDYYVLSDVLNICPKYGCDYCKNIICNSLKERDMLKYNIHGILNI